MIDHTIIRELTPGQTWLAQDAFGREVVLKLLADECLLEGRLHPNIEDRLRRIRELPHMGVANLLSVIREGNRVLAVWQFVPGQTLEQFIAGTDPGKIPLDLRQTIEQSVGALHALGIVHGRLHERNILINERGEILITHTSPLLFYDPAADEKSLVEMFQRLRFAAPPASEIQPQRKRSAHSLLAAAAISLIAIGIAGAILHLAAGGESGRALPPQAPAEAMSP